IRARGTGHRQRSLARGQAGGRRPAGQPALGVQAAAFVQPEPEPDRAVLAGAAAAGAAPPAVRRAGGPEAGGAQQPVVLPNRAGSGGLPDPEARPSESDRISGPVNQGRPRGSPPFSGPGRGWSTTAPWGARQQPGTGGSGPRRSLYPETSRRC